MSEEIGYHVVSFRYGFCVLQIYLNAAVRQFAILLKKNYSPYSLLQTCHKIDYHAHDKSHIDTGPFSDIIFKAAKKISESVKTFQGEPFRFYSERDHSNAPRERERT
ncbi:MAG: hypothetical protein WA364_19130 [Candidatus Nitrosopolaris sp.]